MSDLNKEVDLKQVYIAFTLDAGKLIAKSGDVDMSTKHATRVSLVVTPTTVELRCSPFVWLDASWPASNMNWYGVTYNLLTKTAHASVSKGEGHGFLDYTANAAASIEKMVLDMVAGTKLATKGYNPMSDGDIMGTINGIAHKLTALPSGGGGAAGGVKTADMKSLGMGGTIALLKGVNMDAGEGGVSIPAGGQVSLTVNGSG